MCNRPSTKTCFCTEGYFDFFCAKKQRNLCKKPLIALVCNPDASLQVVKCLLILWQNHRLFAAFQPPSCLLLLLTHTNTAHYLYEVSSTAQLSGCKKNSLLCIWDLAAWFYGPLFQWLPLCFAQKVGNINQFLRTSQANPLFHFFQCALKYSNYLLTTK